MNMNIDIYTKKSYCLSKTISSLTGIDENLFFTSKDILALNIDESGYLYTSLEKNIFSSCKYMNININKQLIETIELSNLLEDNLIIGHLETKNLKYNEVYEIGKNTMHYVEVTGSNTNKDINIIDRFIPTIPPCIYKGNVLLDSNTLTVYLIKKNNNIDCLNVYLNLKKSIRYAILNHKKTHLNFEEYISRINNNLTQDNAMTYNINFITSGYLSIRIMFYINLCKLFKINKTLKNKLEKTLNDMMNLEFKVKILLTKLHFRFSNNLKIQIINTFKDILESELFLIKTIKGAIDYEFI